MFTIANSFTGWHLRHCEDKAHRKSAKHAKRQAISFNLRQTTPKKSVHTHTVSCCRNSLDSLRPYVAFGEEYARGGKGKQPRRPVRLLYRNGESGSQPGAWPEQLVHLPITAIYSVPDIVVAYPSSL